MTEATQQLPTEIQVDGERVSFLPPGKMETWTGQVGDVCDGWVVGWVQDVPGASQVILERNLDEGGALLFWSEIGGTTLVKKPRPGAYHRPPGVPLYLGHTLEEVLHSNRDILGEAVLSQSESSYEAVVGLLPAIRTDRYQILGSPQSLGKYVVLQDGTICTHHRHLPGLIFSLCSLDGRTALGKVYDGLLDDWMPAACYRVVTDEAFYDLIAFVEYDDYRQMPDLHIRLSRYPSSDEAAETEWYCLFRAERYGGGGRLHMDASPAEFYGALASFVRSWHSFLDRLASVDLPEARISRWVRGSLALAATIFEGDHAKYGGARNYGDEYSGADTFPPTLHNTVEAFMAWGDLRQAMRYLDYRLNYVVRDDGTFNFRGPSASEYGRWLWLLEGAERQLDDPDWLTPYLDKLVATGRYLESLRRSVNGADYRLIYLGPEDDNRDDINAYFSNNLWAYRGLKALVQMLERHGRDETGKAIDRAAESLWSDIQVAVRETAVDTEYGPIIPSYVGYPAPPWTLSIGPPVPESVPAEEAQAYLVPWAREPECSPGEEHFPRQWMRENTYANYRYHLEVLSSMLLEKPYAEALDKLRRDRGGEILGTTRIMGFLDDWPVFNYARYLLSTDQINRYLLLYYAHMAHHGNRETLTYYEGVSIDGQVIATDVVPCILTVPLMTAWMLCFEPVGEDAIYLFRGVPSAWLTEGNRVAFQSLGTTAGPVDARISVEAKTVEVNLRLPHGASGRQVYVDLRLGDRRELMTQGKHWEEIEEIERIERGYRLRLRSGLTGGVNLQLDLA